MLCENLIWLSSHPGAVEFKSRTGKFLKHQEKVITAPLTPRTMATRKKSADKGLEQWKHSCFAGGRAKWSSLDK